MCTEYVFDRTVFRDVPEDTDEETAKTNLIRNRVFIPAYMAPRLTMRRDIFCLGGIYLNVIQWLGCSDCCAWFHINHSMHHLFSDVLPGARDVPIADENNLQVCLYMPVCLSVH